MEQQPDHKTTIKKYFLLITYAIVLFLLLYRIGDVCAFLGWMLSIVAPLFYAIGIAFLFNMPMRFYERVLFKKSGTKTKQKIQRGAALILAYLSIIVVIGGLCALITPRLAESVRTLANNFTGYLDQFDAWWRASQANWGLDPATVNWLETQWVALQEGTKTFLADSLPKLFSWTMGVTGGIIDFVLAIMLSGFMLYNKEKLAQQLKRLSRVILKPQRTQRFQAVLSRANVIFSRFILGQITEAFILGILCFIGMQIFSMPYALLISVIIATTSLIPILGPLIGTIPCAFIILVINPPQALWFVLFIIVLQQFEGDLIYPRVVGGAIGLSGLWVLTAILIGGGLFGIMGMLLGVPVFALCYQLVGEWLRKTEKQKAIKAR